MTFGCILPNRGALATPENLRTLATRAEEWGFDHLWVTDHIVLPVQISSEYPYASDGAYPFGREEPYCDALSTLCYLAGCTQNIKLGTHVLILPYRNPILTAKMVSTLDYMSGGRVILGVGAGWLEEEFQALGLNTFAERGKVTNEYIRIFKELWTKDDPEFRGQYHQFSGIKFHPKPVQKPHPPVWIGGHTPAALKRAASLGDGWMPIGLRPPAELEPEELAELVDGLREMAGEAGRSEDEVAIAFSATLAFDPAPGGNRRTLTGTAEEIGADIVLYGQVGVEHFIFSFQGKNLEQMLENMERFAREVKPQVG